MENVLDVYKCHYNKDFPVVCIDEMSKQLVEEVRDIIVAVMANLNTHNCSSLYEAFSPEEAKRIMDKLEIQYTPKHGSWLNMAELELSHLSRQCLNRRIPNKNILKKEINAWENKRNSKEVKVDWQFTCDDARVKLKKLYPDYALK
jgi:hypothetical protein